VMIRMIYGERPLRLYGAGIVMMMQNLQ